MPLTPVLVSLHGSVVVYEGQHSVPVPGEASQKNERLTLALSAVNCRTAIAQYVCLMTR